MTIPIDLYRSEQIKALERFVIQSDMISGFELMRRAGIAVFECLCDRYPNVQNITVFCGAGNNAGDGYIVATLALQAGLTVCVYSVADTVQLQGDARMAYEQYLQAGGIIKPASDEVITADVLVDALFGTGLSRVVSGLYAQAIEAINRSAAFVIAVDIPSGLHSDTGNILGCAVEADVTVTFIGLKQGLFTGFAAQYVGDIVCASLDLPTDAWQIVTPSALRVLPRNLPQRPRYAHKGNFGHVLIIGGDLGYSGAARLAGMAALRVGSGLVSIATHPENAVMMNTICPELMCHGVNNAAQLTPLLTKASVIVVGMGLGQSDWAKALFQAVLTTDKPLIVDADGLNLLAQAPCKKEHWILTPHVGEAARLLNVSTKEIQTDRFHAVQTLQQQYGGVVILKGAGTLITSNTMLAISNTGNAGMASGGMGDVLAGVIAGLVAQGLTLQDAAQQGVYGHGSAADNAVKIDGERGLLASDLLPYLRQWANSIT
jgi:NAD(P)H-hydrate epimerase